MSFWTSLRQNLSLKIISLVAAVLLYAYVQQERNPTIPRTLLSEVVFKNLPEGYEVVPETTHFTVTVTGPRPSVERLKDGDIKATADLAATTSNQPGVPDRVRLTYELPATVSDVLLDAPTEFIKVQVFKQKTRKVEVKAIYKKDAPPGLRYSDPVIHPPYVSIRGREDRVNRVDNVIAIASPTEPKASIDGDFVLTARDNDNNPIEGITITPDTVHVTISQVPEPLTKSVLVSVVIPDQVKAPYEFVSYSTTPSEVLISGSPGRLNSISRIETEAVSVRDLTGDKTMEVNLIIPPDITVRDKQGRLITSVQAQIHIGKKAEPSGPDNASAPSSSKGTGTGPP